MKKRMKFGMLAVAMLAVSLAGYGSTADADSGASYCGHSWTGFRHYQEFNYHYNGATGGHTHNLYHRNGFSNPFGHYHFINC